MKSCVLVLLALGIFSQFIGCAPQNTNSLSTLPKYCTNSGSAYISLPSADKPSDVCECDRGYYASVVPNYMVGGHQLVECFACPSSCPSSCSQTGKCTQ